jgi:hypothetical protein
MDVKANNKSISADKDENVLPNKNYLATRFLVIQSIMKHDATCA